MEPVHLAETAADLPSAWASRTLGEVGPARVKLLRMDELPVAEERHAVAETLLVLDGVLELSLDGEPLTVRSGELITIDAGLPHAVRPGSRGTLLIVDSQDA
ncbi:cupin domain-containing protein [Streptomyces sp. NPDC060194]|uniref:cupin domain-containing protein n=1 Tax=Streptomyces sp. NPDC060194 TaxID=3347069 RepID=UPI0036471E1D